MKVFRDFALSVLFLTSFSGGVFAGDFFYTPTPANPGTATTSDPLWPKHAEYAKYLYKDQWPTHITEITQKYNDNMGSADATKLNSIAGFNNFFAFVYAADAGMRLRYNAMSNMLKAAENDNALMKKAANDGDGVNFRDYSRNVLLKYPETLQAMVKEARTPLLKAATIYDVPIFEADDGVIQAPDPNVLKISTAFINDVTNSFEELAKKVGSNYNIFENEDLGSDYREYFENAFSKLILNSMLTYKKADGTTTSMAFVNFGQFAFHKWGNFGGDGALEAASFQYLDF